MTRARFLVWVLLPLVALLSVLASLWAPLAKAQDYPPVNLSAWRAHQLAVTGAANVLTSSITPSRVGNFRLLVTIPAGGTASVVGFTTDPTGSGPLLHNLNEGVALTAGAAYTFVWSANPGWAYNLQFATGTTVVTQLDLIYNGVN